MTDRELDALVAESVMGETSPTLWLVRRKIDQRIVHEADSERWATIFLNENDFEEEWEVVGTPARYSTNISAAWSVVRKMATGYRDFRIDDAYVLLGKREVFAKITDQASEESWDAIADTAPRAICLVALKCLGVDIPA